jgi:hypothetical protein
MWQFEERLQARQDGRQRASVGSALALGLRQPTFRE